MPILRIVQARVSVPTAPAVSSHKKSDRSYNTQVRVDPYDTGLTILAYSDVPIATFDTAQAFKRIEQGFWQVLLSNTSGGRTEARPRIRSPVGDHSIVAPILRSLEEVYGPVSVIHPDSHLDTWDSYMPGTWGRVGAECDHARNVSLACQSGGVYIRKGRRAHRGLGRKLFGVEIHEVDREVGGFELIEAQEVDEGEGMDGIVQRWREAVGSTAVYLSIDIDVAEVSPPYDTLAEVTRVAASDLLTIN